MSEFARSRAVSHIEARRSCQQNSCYRPHTHDTFSIGYIDSGTSLLTGAPDGPITLRVGDAIIIPAGYVHACNPDGGRWEYQMIHVDQAWLARLVAPQVSAPLFGSISVLRGAHLQHAIHAVSDAIFADAPADVLEVTFRELVHALAATAPAHTVSAAANPEALRRLHPVLERLRNDEVNPTIGDLAALVGMNQFQLIREVKSATGLSPLAWRQNVRVLRGRQLLRRGESIAATAQVLGFADQSHFHRVFQQHVATSPGSYRDAAQERSRRIAT